jgi:hypothetical protein
MAFEPGRKEWKLGFTTGMAQAPRERTLGAGDLRALEKEIERARARFGRGPGAEVISYEAGRDGFWLEELTLGHAFRRLESDVPDPWWDCSPNMDEGDPACVIAGIRVPRDSSAATYPRDRSFPMAAAAAVVPRRKRALFRRQGSSTGESGVAHVAGTTVRSDRRGTEEGVSLRVADWLARFCRQPRVANVFAFLEQRLAVRCPGYHQRASGGARAQ